jgi:hypothetical protein
MSHAYLPQQIPSIEVTTFANGSKAKVLDSIRNRRVFGIANTGTTALAVYLQPEGAGSPIYLRAASTSTTYDGGSLEFNGYNGEVWTTGNGYVYHHAQ